MPIELSGGIFVLFKPNVDAHPIYFFSFSDLVFLICMFCLWTGTSARSTIKYTSIISVVLHDQYI